MAPREIAVEMKAKTRNRSGSLRSACPHLCSNAGLSPTSWLDSGREQRCRRAHAMRSSGRAPRSRSAIEANCAIRQFASFHPRRAGREEPCLRRRILGGWFRVGHGAPIDWSARNDSRWRYSDICPNVALRNTRCTVRSIIAIECRSSACHRVGASDSV